MNESFDDKFNVKHAAVSMHDLSTGLGKQQSGVWTMISSESTDVKLNFKLMPIKNDIYKCEMGHGMTWILITIESTVMILHSRKMLKLCLCDVLTSVICVLWFLYYDSNAW